MSLTPAQVVSLYSDEFVSNCVQVSVAAVLIYEYVLTMDQGVRILRGRRTATFWLFILNQVVMIGLATTNVLEAVPWTQNYVCASVSAIYDAFQLLTYLMWAAISTVRVYVVSKGNRCLAVLVFALSIVQFATCIYSAVMVTNIAMVIGPDMAICDPEPHFSQTLDNQICAIAADVLVLLATWRQTAGPDLTLGKLIKMESRGPFLHLLLRDGALYFIVLLLITVAQIALNYIEALSLGTVFLVPALSVLVSRFLLDIFQAAEDALPASYYDSESKDSSPETGLEFQVMDLEKAKDTVMTYQSSEISSYPSHFTDSGLAWG